MDNNKISSNIDVQLLLSLLKEYGIKRVITSPGFTHVEFIGSIQNDDWFDIYSSIDERSAAYMACGMAAETQEPVVITCTEATASRNYLPGLTEAYYRKLPVLAVTGLHAYSLIGQLEPQVIDRSVSPNDTFVEKVNLPEIKDDNDYWESEIKINRALNALTKNGGGPVHINLPRSSKNYEFNISNPVKGRVIRYYTYKDKLPELPKGKIAIIIGSHLPFTEKQTASIENFCKKHNAVVMCDHTSGYHGDHAFHTALLASQKSDFSVFHPDLIINLGELSGDYDSLRRFTSKADVWRINLDGEIRDPFKRIVKIFAIKEEDFFEYYSNRSVIDHNNYYAECISDEKKVRESIPDLPFSNMYVAKVVSSKLPEDSVIHMGMSNTIRAWSNFIFPKTVESFINVGCRGIDGTMSSLIGASLVRPEKLFFGVLGDLSFFYDLNSLGNRDIRNNLRVIVINNNGGALFKKNTGQERKWFTFEEIDKYIAASHHFQGRDNDLIKHYAEDLGFEYFRASDKQEFSQNIKAFLSSDMREKPMLFEVRTDAESEAKAFEIMSSLMIDNKNKFKQKAKEIIGSENIGYVKKLLGQDNSADFAVKRK